MLFVIVIDILLLDGRRGKAESKNCRRDLLVGLSVLTSSVFTAVW